MFSRLIEAKKMHIYRPSCSFTDPPNCVSDIVLYHVHVHSLDSCFLVDVVVGSLVLSYFLSFSFNFFLVGGLFPLHRVQLYLSYKKVDETS